MNTSKGTPPGRRQRRRHSAEFKASVIQACRHPGVSIAAIALANGLNANMLRKWVIDAEDAKLTVESRRELRADSPATGFIALAPSSEAAQTAPETASSEIRIEVQRGATSIRVSWPSEAAAQCGAWLRELLR